MQCLVKYVYTIQPGDTIYLLANRFRTSVDLILRMNPGIVPTELWLGQQIVICPGSELFLNFIPSPVVRPVPPIGTLPPTTPVPPIGTLPPTTPVPPIGTLPPTTPVPPIGTLPPTTPVPPIGTLPPTTPVPPIGTLPPTTPVPPIGTLPPTTMGPSYDNYSDMNEMPYQEDVSMEEYYPDYYY